MINLHNEESVIIEINFNIFILAANHQHTLLNKYSKNKSPACSGALCRSNLGPKDKIVEFSLKLPLAAVIANTYAVFLLSVWRD